MSGLLVDNLSVHRSGRPILTSAAFTLPPGAVTGLVGPNGAGKSTLLAALLGLVPATGIARFEGHDLPTMPRRDRARLAAFVEQTSATEERLSVRDVVALGRIPFQSALFPGDGRADHAIIEAALAETGMTAFAARRFDTLSGGEQQRVHLARALAQQPRLLLLDEPTSHLDIGAQLTLLALLRHRAGRGVTVLAALHDLNLAIRFCDHLLVLAGGRVVASGPPAEILTPQRILAIWGVHARLLHDPANNRPVIVYDRVAPGARLHNPD